MQCAGGCQAIAGEGVKHITSPTDLRERVRHSQLCTIIINVCMCVCVCVCVCACVVCVCTCNFIIS